MVYVRPSISAYYQGHPLSSACYGFLSGTSGLICALQSHKFGAAMAVAHIQGQR